MPKTMQKRKKVTAAENSAVHTVKELEQQFHLIQRKLSKARGSYLASHQQEVNAARKNLLRVQVQMGKAREKVARATVDARHNGTSTAKNQLKKARAASLLLTTSLKEAKEIMVTAQSNLHEARPFDRKLAARAKVLAKFEKDWEKKMKEGAADRADNARQAAAKRRRTAKKRAAKKVSVKKTTAKKGATKKATLKKITAKKVTVETPVKPSVRSNSSTKKSARKK
jgi:hypothetical protein